MRPSPTRTPQPPRPSSAYRGRAASPPRLGRHSSSRPQPASSHRPNLPFSRSSSIGAEPTLSRVLPAQPAPPHPSAAWKRRQPGSVEAVQQSSNAAVPAGAQQCPLHAASSGSQPAAYSCPPPPPALPAAATPVVSPYAAVYGAAQQQQQQRQPPFGSLFSSKIGPATAVAPLQPQAHGDRPGDFTPAALASLGVAAAGAGPSAGAISSRPPAAGHSVAGPPSTQRKSGNGSDDSSISVAAVAVREATTSPAHKRLRTDAAPSVPSAHNGPDQHLRSPSEQPRHGFSSGGTAVLRRQGRA